MSKNKRKRPQNKKSVPTTGRNEEFAIATRTQHAAAARPRPLATDYRRKPKHAGRGWE